MKSNTDRVIQGDCLEAMRTLPDNSVDSFVSDPPAGIAFMGKKWDTDKGGRKQWCAYMEERFAEALRVCKPGAHGLVWALPRTSHWTATALEDAGWEVRDIVTHHFGSGFPKNHNIGKAIDKKFGADRKVIGERIRRGDKKAYRNEVTGNAYGKNNGAVHDGFRPPITAPATPEAQQWDGWGSALKPASEHWILVRKPIEGTIADNVLAHGVGGINIDGCRVETNDKLGGGAEKPSSLARARHEGWDRPWMHDDEALEAHAERIRSNVVKAENLGRFPANLVLSHSHDCTADGCADGCPVKSLDDQTAGTRASKPTNNGQPGRAAIWGHKDTRIERAVFTDGGDGQNASRYFPNFYYCPKASPSDRSHKGQVKNNHPTVKNRELMRWLCRLVTPPGGTVLDCFAGSGSTAIACLEEGFNYILIEQDTESVQTINDRVNVWLKENKPQPTLEDGLTGLEAKVEAIGQRIRKQKVAAGQLSLLGDITA